MSSCGLYSRSAAEAEAGLKSSLLSLCAKKKYKILYYFCSYLTALIYSIRSCPEGGVDACASVTGGYSLVPQDYLLSILYYP